MFYSSFLPVSIIVEYSCLKKMREYKKADYIADYSKNVRDRYDN